jgi:hypothetical protein
VASRAGVGTPGAPWRNLEENSCTAASYDTRNKELVQLAQVTFRCEEGGRSRGGTTEMKSHEE